jgi:outer membrane protein TolC
MWPALFAALLVGGCAITPTPTTRDEVARRVADDRARMYLDQEPITGPLGYSEVAARAMKYNLDYRLRAMEGVLSQGQLDLARWDMFPRLLVNAGYQTRTPEEATRSRTIETGFESPFHQTSTDRTRTIASAEFSWNVLDFGVSYFRAQQQADQVLIAEERKRKVVQNILSDARNAYWRALGAQRLAGRIDALLDRSTKALERARAIEQQGLMPQPQVLAYQRALLDAIVLLQYRRQELELSMQELTALMNLPPGTRFVLADAPQTPLPAPPDDLALLEQQALNRRPELREEDYRTRITAAEVRRSILATLPNLGLDFSARYDSNRFLLDNSWVDGGLRLSMNLFRLASIPAIQRANDAQRQVDDARRMAQAVDRRVPAGRAECTGGRAAARLRAVGCRGSNRGRTRGDPQRGPRTAVRVSAPHRLRERAGRLGPDLQLARLRRRATRAGCERGRHRARDRPVARRVAAADLLRGHAARRRPAHGRDRSRARRRAGAAGGHVGTAHRAHPARPGRGRPDARARRVLRRAAAHRAAGARGRDRRHAARRRRVPCAATRHGFGTRSWTQHPLRRNAARSAGRTCAHGTDRGCGRRIGRDAARLGGGCPARVRTAGSRVPRPVLRRPS